jgi:NADH-quinone oxidoreductase subunit G
VVDLCPVGALTSKDFRFHKRVWFLQTQEAICNRCARGCSLYVDHHKEKYKDEMIYRYRPRFKDKVNGYFICDAGRLSYKAENENRNFRPMIRGKESEYEYAEGKLLRLVKRNIGKTLLIVSSDLSLEEMVRIKTLASLYDAKINAYEPNRFDATFGDNFLKRDDLSANARALHLLGIDAHYEGLAEGVDKAELILFIGRGDSDLLKDFACETKNIAVLYGYQPIANGGLELLLPIASHTGREGSFINCDGIVQFSSCAISHNNEHKKLLELLAVLQGDTLFTCKDIWEAIIAQMEPFKGIEFKMLQKDGQKIKL